MSVPQQTIDKAVAKHVESMQKAADQTAKAITKRDEIVKEIMSWDDWDDTASNEQIAAFVSYMQTDPMAGARFNEDVIKGFSEFIQEVQQNDMQRLMDLSSKVESFMPQVGVGTNVYMFIVPPEQEGGDWLVVGTPITVSEDFEVSVPETLDFDLQIGLYVTPPEGSGLTGQFNVPAQFTKAGDPVKPFAISYKPDGDGIKAAHLVGHISEGPGAIEPVMGIAQFAVGNVRPQNPGFGLGPV